MEKAKFFKKIVQCLLLQLEKKMYLRSWVTLHGSIQEPHQKILFFSSVLRYQHSCKPFSGKVNHLLMKHHHLGSLMTASRSSFQYIMFQHQIHKWYKTDQFITNISRTLCHINKGYVFGILSISAHNRHQEMKLPSTQKQYMHTQRFALLYTILLRS